MAEIKDSRVLYDSGTTSPKAGNHGDIKVEALQQECFQIILKSNPQNGFLWYLVKDLSHDVVEYTNEIMEPLPKYMGTRQHFMLKAIKPGSCALSFIYKRAWETTSYASLEVTVTVMETDA